MARSRFLPARLLSGRKGISRVEQDEIERHVLDAVAPSRARRARPVWALGLAGVAVALVVLVVGHTHPPADGRTHPPADGFTARGRAAPVADLVLACGGALADVCRRADRLTFDLGRSGGYRYFAAFARGPDGTVVWYFPDSPAGWSVDLDTRARDGVLDRSVVLADHAPGRYRVFGVFSDRALDRAAIRVGFDERGLTAGPGTAVVAREIEIR